MCVQYATSLVVVPCLGVETRSLRSQKAKGRKGKRPSAWSGRCSRCSIGHGPRTMPIALITGDIASHRVMSSAHKHCDQQGGCSEQEWTTDEHAEAWRGAEAGCDCDCDGGCDAMRCDVRPSRAQLTHRQRSTDSTHRWTLARSSERRQTAGASTDACADNDALRCRHLVCLSVGPLR